MAAPGYYFHIGAGGELFAACGIYAPQHPVKWIDDPEEFAALCTRLAREPMVALDVETTLEEPRVLCTIQLGIPGQTWVVDALAMRDLRPVKDLLENAQVVRPHPHLPLQPLA